MSFGGPNQQQQTSTSNLNAASSAGLDQAALADTAGMSLLNQGATQLNAPAAYYNSILSGGSQADAALAPDINRTRAAAGQTMQAETSLAPRGGGRGAALFNTPSQENAQEQSIFNTARPAAAQGATAVGQALGGLGNQALGIGSNYLGTGASAANAGFGAGTTEYNQSNAFGNALGSIAGGLVTLYKNNP